MKTAINRREFIGAFVPPAAAFRLAGQLLKWVFYLSCGYLAVRLFTGVPFDGWKALGLLAVRCVVPAFALVWLAAWIHRQIERCGSLRLRAGMRVASQVLSIVSLMAVGALWYDLWQRKPAEALIGAAVGLLMMSVSAVQNSRRADSSSLPPGENEERPRRRSNQTGP